ncbi:MAG TPA: hypothetical protein VHG91_03940, partial [Longimicrobium sp.]|nr:hypothetical protein [Longimicrobium sp.]
MSLAADPAPGVRFELADPPRSAPETRTDVAGFVGFAARGPLHAPVRVESWPQYEAAFGAFAGGGFLPYAVHAFFENGGRTAWVVRAAVPGDDSDLPLERRARAAWTEVLLDGPPAAHPDPRYDGKAPRLVVSARSPGRWGNGIAVEVAPSGGSAAESARLTVRIEDRSGTIWRLSDASLDPADARYLPSVAAATAGLPAVIDVIAAPPVASPPQERAASLPSARAARRRLRGGRDGTAACTLRHLLGGDQEPAARWGLAALREVDDVAIVAVPDAGDFPAPGDLAPPEPEPVPCSVLDAPDDGVLRFRLPPRDRDWTVDEAAALLGTTPARLRQANPGIGNSIPGGTALRLPLPHAARVDDPRVGPDELRGYFP